jgi:hypothetical protein
MLDGHRSMDEAFHVLTGEIAPPETQSATDEKAAPDLADTIEIPGGTGAPPSEDENPREDGGIS